MLTVILVLFNFFFFSFSFVQFATESLAKQAYEKMQGHVLNGNRLIVDYAKSKKPSEKPQEAQKRKTSTDIKGKYVDKVYAVWICLLHHNITSEKKSSLGLGYGV